MYMLVACLLKLTLKLIVLVIASNNKVISNYHIHLRLSIMSLVINHLVGKENDTKIKETKLQTVPIATLIISFTEGRPPLNKDLRFKKLSRTITCLY